MQDDEGEPAEWPKSVSGDHEKIVIVGKAFNADSNTKIYCIGREKLGILHRAGGLPPFG